VTAPRTSLSPAPRLASVRALGEVGFGQGGLGGVDVEPVQRGARADAVEISGDHDQIGDVDRDHG